MAKKGKNTLQDLDQFLKQQPNTLVNVEKASEAEPETPVQTLSAELLASLVGQYAQQEGLSFFKLCLV